MHTTLIRRLLLPLLLLAVLALGAGITAEVDAAGAEADTRTGAQLYAAACASCHGADGTGAPRAEVGFAQQLPDFTECTFSTREPDPDWTGVVHGGGPVRAFNKLMPAFGDALTEAQIHKTLEHVRSFCTERPAWPQGDLNLPRPLVTSKAFPEDEAVLSTAVDVEGQSSVASKLVYETRLGARGQVEFVLPFTFLEQSDNNWTGGIGDMVLATKWAVLHSMRTGSILSLALEGIVPTGNEDRGLGKGVFLLEPFVAFGQLLPADGFVQLQAGAELSTEPDKAGHELFWRAALGMTFTRGRFGRAFTPMVEILGAREVEDDATTNWDVVPQLQVSLPTRQHILLCAGARLPLNDFGPRTTQYMLYLLWDWFDGGLTEGW